MKNPQRMKYLQLFESFFELNELMGHLREIAKKLIQNLPQENGEITMDDYNIEVNLKSNLDDTVRELLAIIYQNELHVANIFIDFNSPDYPNNIIINYGINLKSEGVSTNIYNRKEMMNKDLINTEKKRKPNWKNNLSPSLPK